MSSNNTPDGKPPKKPAKAKTSKPRATKGKSTAPVVPGAGLGNAIDEPMRIRFQLPGTTSEPGIHTICTECIGEVDFEELTIAITGLAPCEICGRRFSQSSKGTRIAAVGQERFQHSLERAQAACNPFPTHLELQDVVISSGDMPANSQTPVPSSQPETDQGSEGQTRQSSTEKDGKPAKYQKLFGDDNTTCRQHTKDSLDPKKTPGSSQSPHPEPTTDEKNTGDVADPVLSADGIPGEKSVESLSSRVSRLPGEGRSACHERLRRLARSAGMPRGQGPGTAYNWAFEQTDILFTKLAEDNSPPPAPVVVDEIPEETALGSPILSPIGDKSIRPTNGEPAAIAPAPAADLGVSGLGEIPESWPSLPANAQLQVEIAWVSANRLRVRSGNGVDLARALSPAPSYSALSWLETSILFPAKFADISVKATVDQDDEREFIKREKLAIDEIRSILKEMLDAKA